MRKLILVLFLLSFCISGAQAPEKWSSSEIYNHIKKLNFLGSVLYIAAHPDDENTRLISYFSNEKNARTAYLSLTRGDGGQNLIGPELREQLGLIRTQELLAARRIDGGQQFFTRANDFGYSKTPAETLEIWNKDEVLSDVVWIIRKFRPDVIINRFDHRTPGSTHGHHTSSAMLSFEAFDMAGKKDAYPSHLDYLEVYQPKRLFFNTSPWFYGGDEAFKEADKSNFLSFDTGTYFPTRGLSNPEIASLSRSQHRSQGFGSTGSRGKQMEYIELLKGDLPSKDAGIFGGINTSWNRVPGGEAIGNILKEVEENFNFEKPSQHIPQLLKAYKLIQNLKDAHWKEIKTEEIKEIIYASSGLYLEAVAQKAFTTPSEELPVRLEAINRSSENIQLSSVELTPNNSKITPQVKLANNEGWDGDINFKIPESAEFTTPYWLEEKGTMGVYAVNDQNLIGLPETPLRTKATFKINFNGTEIDFHQPVVYKYNDEVYGETYKNFEIIPAVTVSFNEEVLIFNNSEPREVIVQVTANKANIKGELLLMADKNWKIEPVKTNFSIAQSGGNANLVFKITPPKTQNETNLTPEAIVNGKIYIEKLIQINYDHFPNQNLIIPAGLKLVKLDIKKKGQNIAYIEGAGDVIPESLEQIGYNVTKISPYSISDNSLKKFDAVVVGIRAYNIVEELKYKQSVLLEYVKKGGTMIVQYNTNRGLLLDNIAPYNLEISRDRVTNENAEVTFLSPEHPVLNSPNKLTKDDFKGWVQERGLYFPDNWDENFTPILSMHDESESPKNGSLLVAQYGDGYYIYTGISFFRQFPEAVPGAFRLFANLISIGK
ncbi:PIG-L family deacetylase [Christiangramia forsetii]|uniref:Secreted protein n=2 Tax=Christiangramia forsetii TaxID=411153 RepID=A0M2E1_CHRFK|nr:PIG-L family deacetylase [Christiangramia forsetii]GGG39368.1 GlcNAc-PI de-N-acetylase [Christiangramia forsetii]CAL66786.1 secreted protein [Christiangramia forsetii KT0803]